MTSRFGNNPKSADCFDGLMSRTILANADRIVRKDIDHRQFGEASETNRRPTIVGKDQKSGTGRLENAMVGNPVHNGTHPVLANPESDIATGPVLGIEVFVALNVVQSRSVQIGAAADHERQCLRHGLQNVTSRLAGRDFAILREGRDPRRQVLWYLVMNSVLQ